jgi:hypothetical protein
MALMLALVGCLYTVHLDSRPRPVVVELPDGRRVTTPTEVQVRWRPFRRQTLTASAVGYRPRVLRMGELRSHRALGGRDIEVEVLLVPAHGPAGTWSAEDVP